MIGGILAGGMGFWRGDRRLLWLGLGGVGVVLLMLFLAAPANNRLTSGSTWSRQPDGYGAWYAYMVDQGAPIQRWQRPLAELPMAESSQDSPPPPATLVQIYPYFAQSPPTPWPDEWLAAGNRLVRLGQQEPAIAPIFTTQIPTDWGDVRIETRRRATLYTEEIPLLTDEYGAIVWESVPGKRPSTEEPTGQQIFAATPHLAANAYQREVGNFAFLAELVTGEGGPIWVDEYLHGYKDADVVAEEVGGTWLSYLAKTPWLVVFCQVGVGAIAALLAHNRRMGAKRPLVPPVVDNSEAYIQALAGVLHKAGSHEFVVTTLARAERVALQKALGCGDRPVSDAELQAAWQQATGASSQALAPLLAQPVALRQEAALASWLTQLQAVHRSIVARMASK